MTQILKVTELCVDFLYRGEVVNSPLRGINLEIAAGETLGVVGETGCGKTLTATAIIGLLPSSAVQRGKIEFADHGVLDQVEMGNIRGSDIAMIFQNPQSAFNPIFTIGSQMKIVAQRRNINRSDIASAITERLTAVGLTDIPRVLNSYPHQLSGGMLQRCMIAMAMISSPKLLIADEPTTALDATIGDQVLELMCELQDQNGFAILFISHDVTAVAKVSDNISVIYAGRVVESGPSQSVVDSPQHPYTKGLLGAIPNASKARGTLVAIPGSVPARSQEIVGCSFAPRCSARMDICSKEPPIVLVGRQKVACWAVQP